MKGGKDMIKTYTMFNKDDKYTIFNDNQEEIFEIPKKTLSIDGKTLYDVIFSDFEKGDGIKLDKDKSIDESDDKLSIAVYNNVKEIIDKIVTSINDSEEEK